MLARTSLEQAMDLPAGGNLLYDACLRPRHLPGEIGGEVVTKVKVRKAPVGSVVEHRGHAVVGGEVALGKGEGIVVDRLAPAVLRNCLEITLPH